MTRRLLPAVALATLIVLAGCMGGLTNTSTPTADTTAGTPTTETTTSTDALNTTTTALRTTTIPNQLAPGVSKDGIENVTLLALTHRRALLNASSFTSQYQTNSSRPAGVKLPDGVPLNQSIDAQFNRTTARWHTEQLVWRSDRAEISRATEQLLTNNTSYTREGTKGSWEYTTEQKSLTPQEFQQRMLPYTGWGEVVALGGFNFTYVGTVDRDGTTLHKFNSTAFNSEKLASPLKTITSANATFLVDERGIVHHFRITERGTMSAPEDVGTINVSVTRNLTVEDVGSTAVTTPVWVETTRDRTRANTTASSEYRYQ